MHNDDLTFGNYIHGIIFANEQRADDAESAILAIFTEEAIVNAAMPYEGDSVSVDYVTNELINDTQVAAIKQVPGVLNCFENTPILAL